ncbi:hypothetical protein CYMTET_10205, partial [Cymbomonas tetramitiformis]
ACADDFGWCVMFSCTPILSNGSQGVTSLTPPSEVILPPIPVITKLDVAGVLREGESLVVNPTLKELEHLEAPTLSFRWTRERSRFGSLGASNDGVSSKEKSPVLRSMTFARSPDRALEAFAMGSPGPPDEQVGAPPLLAMSNTITGPGSSISHRRTGSAGQLDQDDMRRMRSLARTASFSQDTSALALSGTSFSNLGQLVAEAVDVDVLSNEAECIITKGDIGSRLLVACTALDGFGQESEECTVTTPVVQPGKPHIDRLCVGWFPPVSAHMSSPRPNFHGQPWHSCRFLVQGKYFGGFEGNSVVRWYRLPHGGGPLEPIRNQSGISLEGSLDDVGCCLVAEYVPVRMDGVRGEACRAESRMLITDPETEKEVQGLLQAGSARFEVRVQIREQHKPGMTSKDEFILEKRILVITPKQVKLLRVGTLLKPVDIKGGFAPPFSVRSDRSKSTSLRVVIGEGSSATAADLIMTSRSQRDVAVLLLMRLSSKVQRPLEPEEASIDTDK